MSTRTCIVPARHVKESLGWMASQLETIFGELGISQYLHAFVDQGFDTWETILDITESDLDALGVKLGHRRVSAGHWLPPHGRTAWMGWN
jgi:hypothetical protein